MTLDVWNPKQYARFEAERSQPFFDLLSLVRIGKGRNIVDLGCGTGNLTRILHERLEAARTLGLDSSDAMLDQALPLTGNGLSFQKGDIAQFDPRGEYDLVFSNAALQWVPDHLALLARLAAGLQPGAELAVQVPANDDHVSHALAAELAGEEPYRQTLAGYVRRSNILAPESYAALLHRLGFAEQHVRLQVYGHLLGSRADVVEWVKGTLLTDYRRRLTPALYESFLADYARRLLPQLEDAQPYFYPFKRILFWARR